MISKNVAASRLTGEAVVDEDLLQNLLPSTNKLELDMKARMLSILDIKVSHLIAHQRFTKNEWSIIITLFAYYPYYAPHEALLASITLLSLEDCREIIHAARLLGEKAFKQELKPVYRALSSSRKKICNLSPHLNITLLRDAGYLLNTNLE
jgi:hypothetical protein